jgi:type I restriction enzyme S subunit
MNKINTARLGDLVEITGGGTPSRAIAEYWGGTIPWVTVKDFVSNRIVAAQESITEKGLKNSASNLIPAESILMPTRMALGKIAINAIPVAINQDIKALHVKDMNTINQNYLVRYLLTNSNVLEKAGKGATVKGIKLDFLKSLIIPLPFLNDQIRIATVLTRAEKLIAKRKESIKALDELLKSTFLEMFGDPVRNDKRWETLPMNEVGKFISGGTPSKDRSDYWVGTFPWVSPKDMKTPYLSDAQDHISEKVFQETNLKKIASGHLLIVVRGMILAHTFPTAINTVQVSINQDMKAILPTEGLLVQYLKNCLDSMVRQILAIITTAGHGTKKFDTDVMAKVLIPIPPMPLQIQFANAVTKIESLKSLYTQSLTALENLYASLSQRAFKGELDLSHVPLLPDEKEGVSVLINK